VSFIGRAGERIRPLGVPRSGRSGRGVPDDRIGPAHAREAAVRSL